MNWYPYNPKDFMVGTVAFTTEEVGAYQLLLNAQWDMGGRLPADEGKLAKIARLSTRRFRRLWESSLADKFKRDDDGYYNQRLERERRKAIAKAEARSNAARTAAEARWSGNDDASRMPDASETECVKHSTHEGVVSKSKFSKSDEKDAELPEALCVDSFRAKWREWLTFRRAELRKSVTPTAAKKQLSALAPLGPALAIDCLELSMRNGWQGVFPEKVRGTDSKSRRPNPEDSDLTPTDYSYLDNPQ